MKNSETGAREKTMKIGVLIKTLKLVYAQTGMELADNFVSEDDIVRMINPLDEAALEYALQLKDRHTGVQVVALSYGDAAAEDGLRRCLAMGADRAVFMECKAWENLDTAATAQFVSDTCKKESFDLILSGATTIDDNDGLLGAYVAEQLGMAYASSIVDIEIADASKLKLQRIVEGSDRQLLESTFPVLLSVEKGSIIPRYPTLTGFLSASKVELERMAVAEGSLAGASLTEITSYSRPRPKRKRQSRANQELPPAEDRISFMVNGDASKAKSGGSVVDADSKEMFERFDDLLLQAGVLRS